MIHLIHELVHYSAIERNRNERKKQIVNAISELITNRFFNIEHRVEQTEQDTIERSFNSLFSDVNDAAKAKDNQNNFKLFIREYVCRHINEVLDEKKMDSIQLLSVNLKKHIQDALRTFSSPHNVEIFLSKMYDKLYDLRRPRSEDLGDFMANFNTFADIVTKKTCDICRGSFPRIGDIFLLMDESFSDLISFKVYDSSRANDEIKIDYLKEFANLTDKFAKTEGYRGNYEYMLSCRLTLQRICAAFKVHYGEDVFDFLDKYENENSWDSNFIEFEQAMKALRDSDKDRHEILETHTIKYLESCNVGWDTGKRKEELKELEKIFKGVAYPKNIETFWESFRKIYKNFFGK